MANPYNENLALLQQKIAEFAAKIKQISLEAANAETAQVAENALKLEGLTLEQIMELVSTTAGLTVAEVQAQLDDLIADLEGVPRKVADSTEVLDAGANNLIMSPAGFWSALGHFWEEQIGAAPETLNEIHEIAAAIQDNQGAIQSIQEWVANKATKQELADEATRLEEMISQAQEAATTEFATQPEVDEGVVDDKAVAPNTLKVRMDTVRGEMEGDVNQMIAGITQAFDDAINILEADDGNDD